MIRITLIIVNVIVRHTGEIRTILEFGEYVGDGKDAHEDGYCDKNPDGFRSLSHVKCKWDVRLSSPEFGVLCNFLNRGCTIYKVDAHSPELPNTLTMNRRGDDNEIWRPRTETEVKGKDERILKMKYEDHNST
jgi:hypothetical protein